MSNRKPTDLLWKLLEKIGIDNYKQSKYILSFFVILSIYFLTQSIFCTFFKWDNVSSRYLAMEDIEFSLYALWIHLELFFKPEDALTMLRLIDNDYFNYEGFKLSDEKNKLIKENDERVLTIVRVLFFLIFCHVGSNSIPPLLITLYRKTVTEYFDIISNQTIDKGIDNDLPLPFEYCLPYHLNDHLIVYAIIFLIHIFYGHYAYFFCSTVMLSGVAIVLDRLTTDMKILNLFIGEMDNYFNLLEQSENKLDLETNLNREYEVQLRHFQRQVLENHKIIIRNVKKANNAVGISSMDTNQAAAWFGCISLYRSIEIQNWMDGMKYAVVFGLICVIVFIYCLGGQKMQNEDEKFRNTLAEFNWINKPIWFQKSHLTMMIRSNRTLEVKPYGLYTLNYDNFTNVIKAAYTYCNVLRTIRKK